MRVGIAYSLAPPQNDQPLDGPDDHFEEFDKIETVEAIADVIRGEGNEIILLGDGREFLTRVLADPLEFVFNIAEGEGVGRSREARVPAVLEMLGIPYSGSDPLTLATCLDKGVAKSLVSRSEFLRVPRGWSLQPTDHQAAARLFAELFDERSEPRQPRSDQKPTVLILKPEFEGSSKGIRGKGVAGSADQAHSIFEALGNDYQQNILVEEFIDGDEWTVGFAGDACPLGAMRIVPKVETERFVYSLDVKRDWINQVEYQVFPRGSSEVVDRIIAAATSAFRTLGCRDLARIDFRVRDGIPYFIEANPLPGLAPVTSDLVILANGLGMSHADLIRTIFRASLARLGLLGVGG